MYDGDTVPEDYMPVNWDTRQARGGKPIEADVMVSGFEAIMSVEDYEAAL